VPTPGWDLTTALGKPGIREVPFDNANGNLQGWSHGVEFAINPIAVNRTKTTFHELGHIVWYQRLTPWNRQYMGAGRICSVVILRAMELVGSEDIMSHFDAHSIEIGRDEDGIHYMVDKETKKPLGKRFDPELNVDDI
jgi:hypothetical protein